jgi:branched-subunit amino acid transport protein
MTFWALIIFSAVTIFIFRYLPFLFKNHALLQDKQSRLYRFLSYSAQAMLGLIIYETAFPNKHALDWLAAGQGLDGMKLGLLLLTFVVVVRTKKLLPVFFVGLGIYWLILQAMM